MDENARAAHYQSFVEQLREHENKFYSGWPGKPCGTPAHSKYPNIVAELNAETHSIKEFASWANVSPEIMAAIIEDGEELFVGELNGIVTHLKHYHTINYNYIVCGELQVIDPGTRKGKLRAVRLREAMHTLEREDIPWGDNDYFFNKGDKETVTLILKHFELGKLVSYAGYRRALDAANSIMARAERALMRAQSPAPRTERTSQ